MPSLEADWLKQARSILSRELGHAKLFPDGHGALCGLQRRACQVDVIPDSHLLACFRLAPRLAKLSALLIFGLKVSLECLSVVLVSG